MASLSESAARGFVVIYLFILLVLVSYKCFQATMVVCDKDLLVTRRYTGGLSQSTLWRPASVACSVEKRAA